MKRLITRTLLCSAVAAGLFFVAQGTASAALSGKCVTCHTMHNSQDGTSMNGTTTANNQLLLTGCIACHTGDVNATTGKNATYSAPVVLQTTAAPSSYLAGGNFWWVDQASSDSKGHNVIGIEDADSALSTAPGGTVADGITCEACHGDLGHHSDTQTSYRFLSGAVKGVEDANWEVDTLNTETASHNVYFGGTDTTGANGISDFCAECHGDFHGSANLGGTASDPWTRHPTDIQLSDAGGEYLDYNTYNTEVPTGATDTSASTNEISAANNNDVVVCVSCHRAHGSPYDDMLRWSYTEMVAGGSATNGCFRCHTTK
jgi:predicted CXXCH cytochrome family protein